MFYFHVICYLAAGVEPRVPLSGVGAIAGVLAAHGHTMLLPVLAASPGAICAMPSRVKRNAPYKGAGPTGRSLRRMPGSFATAQRPSLLSPRESPCSGQTLDKESRAETGCLAAGNPCVSLEPLPNFSLLASSPASEGAARLCSIMPGTSGGADASWHFGNLR